MVDDVVDFGLSVGAIWFAFNVAVLLCFSLGYLLESGWKVLYARRLTRQKRLRVVA